MRRCLITMLLILGGCSNGGTPTEKVTGEVTLDGQPLAAGTIQFHPIAGDSQTAGAEIKDGKFQADVPLAKMRVEISAPRVVGQHKAYDTPDSPVVDDVVELIPNRYNVNSELTLDVTGGTPPQKFVLQSK